MTNRGIIAAAVVLGASMLSAVALTHHFQETRVHAQEQKAECAENKAALERCLNVPYPSNEQRASCRNLWQPVIAKACSK